MSVSNVVVQHYNKLMSYSLEIWPFKLTVAFICQISRHTVLFTISIPISPPSMQMRMGMDRFNISYIYLH